MTTRADLHALIDELSEADLEEARLRLESLRNEDPLLQLLEEAPDDDEPYTDEEQRATAEARQRMDRGEWTSWEELKRTVKNERVRSAAGPTAASNPAGPSSWPQESPGSPAGRLR